MDGRGQRHPDGRGRHSRHDARLARDEAGVEVGEVLHAHERPRVGGAVLVEQQRAGPVGDVLGRAVQEPHVVEAHRAGAAGERHGAVDLRLDRRRIDGAAETPVGVMVPDGAGMALRHDEERPVLEGAVVEHDADGEQVVVGVGIERPVLMPLDRRAVARRLHVELRAVEPDAGADELLDDADEPRVPVELLESREEAMRRLDSPHAGRVRPMPRLQIVDVGMRGEPARLVEDLVHLPAEALDQRRLEHARHHHIPVLAIERHVAVRDHLGLSLWATSCSAGLHHRS